MTFCLQYLTQLHIYIPITSKRPNNNLAGNKKIENVFSWPIQTFNWESLQRNSVTLIVVSKALENCASQGF